MQEIWFRGQSGVGLNVSKVTGSENDADGWEGHGGHRRRNLLTYHGGAGHAQDEAESADWLFTGPYYIYDIAVCFLYDVNNH